MTEFPIKANVQPAVKDIDQLITALRKAGVEAGLTEKEINDITAATRKVKEEGTKNIGAVNQGMNQLGQTAKTIGATMLAAFTFDKIVDFGKQVVAITAEFQKFEAVLTNTLGSKSAAQRALTDITKFASVTPFSVRELTDSFVKLANQGFKPTIEQMRKLGDIASSTGKSFDQLTEALLDAQTGQFERLKDFGIKAQKQGDQVTFSFKGVATQVEYTNGAMRDYILSLGDMIGVSGSAAAISGTLGGKINNLEDDWGQLMLAMGKSSDNVFTGVVQGLSDIIKTLRLMPAFIEQVKGGFSGLSASSLDAILNFADTNSGKSVKDIIKPIEAQSNSDFFKNINANMKTFTDSLTKEGEDLDEVLILWKRYVAVRIESTKQDAEEAKGERLKAVLDAKEAAKKHLVDIEKEKADKLAKAYDELIRKRQQFLDSFLKEGTTDPVEEVLLGDPFATVPFYDAKALDADTKRVAEGMNNSGSISDPESTKTKADKNKQIEQAAADFSINLINTVAQMQNAADEEERARLREKYDYELSLAGDNEDAKAAIKRKFDAEDKAIRQREAQRNRETALFDIAVNTARAIVAALPNVPLSIFAGATGALQLIKVLGTQLPKYKDGVFQFQGVGSETSDSNLALLSRNESVVSAEKTRRFGDILKPMIENENFDYADLRNVIDRKLPSYYVPITMGSSRSNEFDQKVLDKLSGVEKAIANKKEVRLEFDKNGFGQWVGKQGDWTKYVSGRYKI